ncbi:MAG TPA: type IV pilus secretin PilQ [Candidatus Dormibacteraeota bacterium]|nr:type IV pilus secretin PilQ [Candidatus Dormibacteraeota bacterium]
MKIKWPAFGFGCLLLASAAVAALPACAQLAAEASASTAAQKPSISTVQVAHTGQQTTVRIDGTGALHYRTSHLNSPPRLVLDFSDTRLAAAHHRVPSEYAPVLQVRMGKPNAEKSRVVIDLAKFVPYKIQQEGSSITVSFTAPAAQATPASFRAIRKPAPEKTATLNVPKMPLPTWLTGKDMGFASPANVPAAPAAEPVPQAAPQLASYDGKKYTGAPISVNLKDVDLKDFFRLIHEISGLNVVLDPAVHGTVTLVLDQVPWDQALDIVLRNNGLTKEIDGNVLRIATQATLKSEADQRRELLKAQSDAIEPVTVTRVLSYAQANSMVGTLKTFLSPRGTIYADARSNTLIIRDIPSSIPKIDDLLRQLDRKSKQVEIDARVVQASRSFAREIGTQLAYSFGAGNNTFGGNTSVGTSPVIRTVIPPFSSPAYVVGSGAQSPGTAVGVQMPLATNLAATAATSGLTYIFSSPNFALDFMLSLMESRGVGKVLSEPKGITQNNEKLTVKQGTKIPIQTSINNTIAVQYVDAVLKLEVTPQITAAGTVFLDITVENTQIDQGIARIQGMPALDTQSTQTKVLVNDGGTVAIGGVVVNNQTTSVDQVPLLGSMPLIGNLFKHTSISVSTQELLFFVTPRILPG